MRPAGEVRLAVLAALRRSGRATSRAAAEMACVGFDAATVALNNLVRDGKVVKRDPIRVPGVKRPVPTYELYSTQLLSQVPLWPAVEARA